MPKYLSNRSKRTPQGALTTDRYRYLGIEQAEPNLGDPTLFDTEVNLPLGPQYQIISVVGYPGQRFWLPRGGGLIPGAITIYDENTIIPSNAGISSITTLQFKGNAIQATGYLNPDNSPGTAVTITVSPPGNNGDVLYKDFGDFATSSKLVFNNSVGILTIGNGLNVGIGGTLFTVKPTGLVGIGTSTPTQELHVQGDIRLTGTIYDYFNSPGNVSEILVKGSLGGLEWINQSSVRSGAGGTYTNVQYHNSAGLVDGAENFVYDPVNKRVGIGSTSPKYLLDVVGYSSFKGQTDIDNLKVGIATIETLGVTGTTTTRNLQVTGITTVGFLTGTNAYYSGIVTAGKFVGDVDVVNLNVSGVATIKTLKVTGLATTKDFQVTGIATIKDLNVEYLSVTGLATVGNVEIQTNTISTKGGGDLILDSSSGTTRIDDSVFINDTTSSISTTTGALRVRGGIGVRENINVGGEVGIAKSLKLSSTIVDYNGQVGAANSVLTSIGIGVSWVSIEQAALQGRQGTQGLQATQGTQGRQGLQGTQGLQATQGTQGRQGSQGLQGTQGLQGAGNQGSQGIQSAQGTQGVSNQGLGGGQGSQGLQSAQGTQGLSNQGLGGGQGAQGTQGTQGVSNQGLGGGQGSQGLQSAQGTQGASNQGLGGGQGAQGAQGRQGTQGASNQGLGGGQGSQGLQGTQGSSNQGLGGGQGAQGTQGRQGIQGASSQGLGGGQGAQGTQGLQSSQGTQGSSNQGLGGGQGAQGTQGRQGIQGAASQGLGGGQGAQGTQSIQGTQGPASQGLGGGQGAQGTQGLQSTQGVQGLSIQGASGSTGSFDGTSNIRINNGAPTITFADTDNRGGFIHVNGNIFYVLRAGTTALGGVGGQNAQYGEWSQVNNRWPLEINLDTNNALFGGSISAIGDITAFFSDERLKTNIELIKNPLDKVLSLRGFTYNCNETAKEFGFDEKERKVGVSAQDVLKVLPEAVKPAPVNDKYYTVQYEKLVPLLIEAIKELKKEVDELKGVK